MVTGYIDKTSETIRNEADEKIRIIYYKCKSKRQLFSEKKTSFATTCDQLYP